MDTHFFQIGSFPALSRTEIKSVFPGFSPSGNSKSTLFTGKFNTSLSFQPDKFALPEIQKKFDELGGAIRLGKILGAAAHLHEVISALSQYLAAEAVEISGKIRFGMTWLGSFRGNERKLKTLLIGIKKECAKRAISVRFVNRNFRNLDAGTFWKEKLNAPGNAEFCVWQDGEQIFYSKTLAAQDVEAFAARDYGKPVRDMQIGMLPPKLALMMVNFSRDEQGNLPQKIWDPFCGTGTILIEAARLGCEVFGSDLEAQMVEASRRNMRHFFPDFDPQNILQHDAATPLAGKIEAPAIVTEGYLGPIFHKPVSAAKIQPIQAELETLYENFFRRLPHQTERIIFALPFWRNASGGFLSLQKPLEKATEFGYTVRAFSEGTKRGSLEFMRENQVVGREIFRFTRV